MSSIFHSEVFPAQWKVQSAIFGRTVTYHPGGVEDPPAGVEITAILREGVFGEEQSPGRYAHLMVRDADLPAAPVKGDVVEIGEALYEVVLPVATIYGVSDLTIQAMS